MSRKSYKADKYILKSLGIHILQKDVKSSEYIKREDIGHRADYTKDTVKVTMKDGTEYIYTATPTSIYSAVYNYELVKEG